jgi:hypothetical protein
MLVKGKMTVSSRDKLLVSQLEGSKGWGGHSGHEENIGGGGKAANVVFKYVS